MNRIIVAATAAVLLGGWGGGALAQTTAERARAFDALVACRAETDQAKRLACFDTAAAALDQAEKAGDVVVVDRAQVREARRSAFGFDFDGLKLFERGERTEPVMENVTLVAERAYRDAGGKWVVITADGQTWRQVDSERVYKTPQKGSEIAIRKAALGSYFMNIDGQRAIRARREK